MKIAAMAPLQARWATLAQREQGLIRGAAVLVGLALMGWLLVTPPLRTLSQAPGQQRSLDVQWQKMQQLRAQALVLQAQPKISRDDTLRALDAAVKQQLGGSAQLAILGDSATITLRNTPADALARWLTQTRVNARAVPSEARLVRSSVNPAGPAAWDGTLVMRLPAQ